MCVRVCVGGRGGACNRHRHGLCSVVINERSVSTYYVMFMLLLTWPETGRSPCVENTFMVNKRKKCTLCMHRTAQYCTATIVKSAGATYQQC